MRWSVWRQSLQTPWWVDNDSVPHRGHCVRRHAVHTLFTGRCITKCWQHTACVTSEPRTHHSLCLHDCGNFRRRGSSSFSNWEGDARGMTCNRAGTTRRLRAPSVELLCFEFIFCLLLSCVVKSSASYMYKTSLLTTRSGSRPICCPTLPDFRQKTAVWKCPGLASLIPSHQQHVHDEYEASVGWQWQNSERDTKLPQCHFVYRPVEMRWHARRNQISSFVRNGRVHFNRPWGVSSADCWQPRCAPSAVVMLDTPCCKVVWRVLATHTIRQFPLYFPTVRHRVPSHFNCSLPHFSRGRAPYQIRVPRKEVGKNSPELRHCLYHTARSILHRTVNTLAPFTKTDRLMQCSCIIALFFFRYFGDRASQYIYLLISTNLMHWIL